MKIEVIAVLFSALVGVQCAPGLKLFALNIPLDKIGKDKGSLKLNVELTKDGLELSRLKESYSEENHLDEQRNSNSLESSNRDSNSSHSNQEQSNTSKVRESHEFTKKTQDSGLKLGKGGLNIFNNKKETEYKITSEQESGQNSSVQKDRSANSKHDEESGSEYSKSTQTKEHTEEYENKGLTIGGKGGLFKKTKEQGSSQSYDTSKHEEGSDWKKTKDATKEGNKVKSTASNQASNYANDSNDSNATSTHNIETKVYKRGEETQGTNDKRVVDKDNNNKESKLAKIKDNLKNIGKLFG